MYEYMKGKVVYIGTDYIIIDNSGVGYKIYTTSLNYVINQEVVLYLYLFIGDNLRCLYGFNSKLEREVFLKFLQVKSIGVKTAFGIVKDDNYDLILSSAFSDNYDFLLTLNKINEKNVDFLIKNLKTISYKNFYKIDENYYKTLKSLDYADNDIYKSYKLVNKNQPNNLMVKEGIRIIEGGDL